MSGAAVSSEWSDEAFSHPPLADHTGPFPHRPFLEAWWRHESHGDELALVSTDDSTLPLRLSEGSVLFCGDADLTDYHNPLGDPQEAIGAAGARFSGTDYRFDSLPGAAARPLLAALDAGGHRCEMRDHTVTAVIDLPDDPEAWLAGIGKRNRHELRRKRRRFDEILGDAHLERRADREAVALFAQMHRAAAGEKGGFMTDAREEFFADLVANAGAAVDVLSTDDGPVAAAFAFAQADGYYLYNSAYSPNAASASPGIALLAGIIETLIADGVPRLDLLKGDEPYKFRLGAAARPLYRIEGTFA